jgi:hypothetical protein
MWYPLWAILAVIGLNIVVQTVQRFVDRGSDPLLVGGENLAPT